MTTYTLSPRAWNGIKVLSPEPAAVPRRLRPPVMPSVRAGLVNGHCVKPMGGVDMVLFGRAS